MKQRGKITHMFEVIKRYIKLRIPIGKLRKASQMCVVTSAPTLLKEFHYTQVHHGHGAQWCVNVPNNVMYDETCQVEPIRDWLRDTWYKCHLILYNWMSVVYCTLELCLRRTLVYLHTYDLFSPIVTLCICILTCMFVCRQCLKTKKKA